MQDIKIEYRIFEVRTMKGFSLRELSQRSGVSKSELHRIELNTVHPTLYTLIMIATSLKVPLKKLIEIKVLDR